VIATHISSIKVINDSDVNFITDRLASKESIRTGYDDGNKKRPYVDKQVAYIEFK